MTDSLGKSQQQIQFEEQNLDLELMILTPLLSLRGDYSTLTKPKGYPA